MSAVIQYILYLAVLIVLAIPLGAYIKKVMNGEKTFLSKILTPCENAVYKVMRVNKEEQMNWKNMRLPFLFFPASGLCSCFYFSFYRVFCPEIHRGCRELNGICPLIPLSVS